MNERPRPARMPDLLVAESSQHGLFTPRLNSQVNVTIRVRRMQRLHRSYFVHVRNGRRVWWQGLDTERKLAPAPRPALRALTMFFVCLDRCCRKTPRGVPVAQHDRRAPNQSAHILTSRLQAAVLTRKGFGCTASAGSSALPRQEPEITRADAASPENSKIALHRNLGLDVFACEVCVGIEDHP
jgi:hypothetical protein